MRFIHTADIHLGASPDAGSAYTRKRSEELWDSLSRLIDVCEVKKVDLLLIAGDMFHRQPLLRELKELDYLFSKLTHTKVVFIVGNHDYLKPSSYYLTYKWESQVYPILSLTMDYVEFEELGTCVYGLSYDSREIREALYTDAFPKKRQPIEILLAHGGDEKHIPINRNNLIRLGYDYIAMGHIHRPGEVEKNRIYYSGSLEPTDKNDTGKHGYILGEIQGGFVKAKFVPFASREYIHAEVAVDENTTGRELKEKIGEMISEQGTQNLYKITLTGRKNPDVEYDLSGMDVYGNILEFADETSPAFDFEKLERQNRENLLGVYIESMKDSPKGSEEYLALFVGVRALLDTKRG